MKTKDEFFMLLFLIFNSCSDLIHVYNVFSAFTLI